MKPGRICAFTDGMPAYGSVAPFQLIPDKALQGAGE
jgi:hypothetical protein